MSFSTQDLRDLLNTAKEYQRNLITDSEHFSSQIRILYTLAKEEAFDDDPVTLILVLKILSLHPVGDTKNFVKAYVLYDDEIVRSEALYLLTKEFKFSDFSSFRQFALNEESEEVLETIYRCIGIAFSNTKDKQILEFLKDQYKVRSNDIDVNISIYYSILQIIGYSSAESYKLTMNVESLDDLNDELIYQI